jgi:hypothetical protein
MLTRIVALIDTEKADFGRIAHQVSLFLQDDPEILSVRVWIADADSSDKEEAASWLSKISQS